MSSWFISQMKKNTCGLGRCQRNDADDDVDDGMEMGMATTMGRRRAMMIDCNDDDRNKKIAR